MLFRFFAIWTFITISFVYGVKYDKPILDEDPTKVFIPYENFVDGGIEPALYGTFTFTEHVSPLIPLNPYTETFLNGYSPVPNNGYTSFKPSPMPTKFDVYKSPNPAPKYNIQPGYFDPNLKPLITNQPINSYGPLARPGLVSVITPVLPPQNNPYPLSSPALLPLNVAPQTKPMTSNYGIQPQPYVGNGLQNLPVNLNFYNPLQYNNNLNKVNSTQNSTESTPTTPTYNNTTSTVYMEGVHTSMVDEKEENLTKENTTSTNDYIPTTTPTTTKYEKVSVTNNNLKEQIQEENAKKLNPTFKSKMLKPSVTGYNYISKNYLKKPNPYAQKRTRMQTASSSKTYTKIPTGYTIQTTQYNPQYNILHKKDEKYHYNQVLNLTSILENEKNLKLNLPLQNYQNLFLGKDKSYKMTNNINYEKPLIKYKNIEPKYESINYNLGQNRQLKPNGKMIYPNPTNQRTTQYYPQKNYYNQIPYKENNVAEAILRGYSIDAEENSNKAVVRLFEEPNNGLYIDFTLCGLKIGSIYSIYVHDYGEISSGCESTGDQYGAKNTQFNPILGLKTNPCGFFGSFKYTQDTLRFQHITKKVTLQEILARSIVIHELNINPDILPVALQGNLLNSFTMLLNPMSSPLIQGKRVACGIIGRANPISFLKTSKNNCEIEVPIMEPLPVLNTTKRSLPEEMKSEEIDLLDLRANFSSTNDFK